MVKRFLFALVKIQCKNFKNDRLTCGGDDL
jgi:hypothetical protein